MKVTYDLPEELVRELKVRAAQQGRTVKDVVAEMLHGVLYGEDRKLPDCATAAIIEHDANGFPYFKCGTDAPAVKMTLEELLALEEQADEEDALQRAGLSH
jgi:plasmid stability protein